MSYVNKLIEMNEEGAREDGCNYTYLVLEGSRDLDDAVSHFRVVN